MLPFDQPDVTLWNLKNMHLSEFTPCALFRVCTNNGLILSLIESNEFASQILWMSVTILLYFAFANNFIVRTYA